MPLCPQPLSSSQLQTLLNEACAAQAEDRLDQALEQYLKVLGYLPEAAVVHYNVGLIYFRIGDFPQALQAFSQALTHGPEDSDTLFNLALCQKKNGDCTAAAATYERILAAAPDNADCLYNLAGCYRELHDDQRAMDCYRQVLAQDRAYLPAANNLAYLHHRAGEMEQAQGYYRQVLELRPEDESVRFLLACVQGEQLDHPPDTYIREFFDTYAQDFEHSLVDELGYDNPRKLFQCYLRTRASEAVHGRGLDLGCGTGLSGVAFKGVIARLDGVDLSANMLALAADKDCYATLITDSIGHHLATTAERYDLFLATDVFIYIGELSELFAAAHRIARPEALFCFSTEHLQGSGYELRTTGRFAYSRTYISALAAATGWSVLRVEATRLRKERDQWLAGDLWILGLGIAPPAIDRPAGH